MPRLKSDLLHIPPKANCYERHNTSSMPIQIPTRRRPVESSEEPPLDSPVSPDLIFEMSPVTSGIPPPALRDFGLSDSASNMSTNEPFTYSFPKIPVLQNCTNSGDRTQAKQTSALSINGSTLAPVTPSATTKQLPLPSIDDCSTSALPHTYPPNTTVKSHPTTKIMGFAPVTPVSTRLNSPTRSSKILRLSPPPRSSSYSSSPWILPGKSEAREIESGSLETESGSFEFKRHLMRRIENQTPSRFRRISALSSMRV